jgi:hypothetical protein
MVKVKNEKREIIIQYQKNNTQKQLFIFNFFVFLVYFYWAGPAD